MTRFGCTLRAIGSRGRGLALWRALHRVMQPTRRTGPLAQFDHQRRQSAIALDMVYNWDDKEFDCYRLYVEEKRSLDDVLSYWETRGFTPRYVHCTIARMGRRTPLSIPGQVYVFLIYYHGRVCDANSTFTANEPFRHNSRFATTAFAPPLHTPAAEHTLYMAD